MTTNAQIVAEAIASQGVPWVFGLPGGEISPLLDAIRRSGLEFILAGHEASAAFMADVVGQLSGKPGVCVATLGPGAVNLSLGLANAFLDRSPVIVITAQIPSHLYASFPHQRIDLRQLFGAITKHVWRLNGEGTEALVLRAFEVATEPRPGPIHLELASDVAERAPVAAPASFPASPSEESENGADVRDVATEVSAAARPLILVGLGAAGPRDAPAVRMFIDELGIPFMVTPKAKGVVPEDHPAFLGVACGMALDRVILDTLELADLIVGVGFDPVECDKAWFLHKRIVNVDRVRTAQGGYRPIEIIGEVPVLLRELSDAILQVSRWPRDLLKTRREALVQSLVPLLGPGLSPLRVLETLREIVPREGIVTCDVGSHKYLVGQFWKTYEPYTVLMSNGLSGMGYGLPAAIAANLVHPDRPVLAIVGDGGMSMMIHNLALLAERQIPVTVVVLVDNSLSLIEIGQSRRGLTPYGVRITPPAFSGVAQAYGLAANRVERLQDLRQKALRSLEERVPMLIEVPIDIREYYEYI